MTFESFVKLIQSELQLNLPIELSVLLNLGNTGIQHTVKFLLKLKIYLGFLLWLRMINLQNIL